MRNGKKALNDRLQFLRAKRTVDAERGNAQIFKERRADLGRGAVQRAAGLIEGHRGKDGLICLLFERQNARFEFGKIGKSFDDIPVDELLRACGDLGERFERFFEGERAEGLHHAARGADIEKHLFARRPRV